MKSKAIQLTIAILIGGSCLYLFSSSVDWSKVWAAMTNIHYGWVCLAFFISGLSIYIRAIRWQVFLGEPKITIWKLFLIGNIGFMGNGIFPARMGELIRPVLVWRTTTHRFTTALATIVVERVYDLLGLLLILAFVFYTFPFPSGPTESGTAIERTQQTVLEQSAKLDPSANLKIDNPILWIKELAKYGIVLFILLFSSIGVMTFAPAWSLKAADRILTPIPKGISSKILKAIESFEKGAATFRNPVEFFYCLFWTMVLWLSVAFSELVVLWAFGINSVTFGGALFLMAGLCFAVMFPQLPGFIGMYHFAVLTILSDTFFIEKSQAGAVAMIMWLTQVPVVIILGFISLIIMGISFKDISHVQKEIPQESPDEALENTK